MITNLAAVKNSMQIQPTDTSRDQWINALLLPVDAMIKKWLGRNLEQVGACVAPVQSAAVAAAGGFLTSGTPYFWVVTATNYNGETVASNETTLTPAGGNLAATISWNTVANATGYNVYRGTTTGQENVLVASVNQLTLQYVDVGATQASQAPPATGTAIAGYTEYLSGNWTSRVWPREGPITVAQLTAIYYDQYGFYGQNPTGFPATSLMTPGTDYYLVIDKPDGQTSLNCFIERNQGIWPGRIERNRGRLTPQKVTGHGNIKVQHNGGYAVVPPQITEAANKMIARMLVMGPTGFLATSESFEDRSISIDLGKVENAFFATDVVSLLLPFRRLQSPGMPR